jgi:hypothetical protein
LRPLHSPLPIDESLMRMSALMISNYGSRKRTAFQVLMVVIAK